MAHFPKPGAGSWTENWPELGTAPVDYTDSIDPERYKLERIAGSEDRKEGAAAFREKRPAKFTGR